MPLGVVIHLVAVVDGKCFNGSQRSQAESGQDGHILLLNSLQSTLSNRSRAAVESEQCPPYKRRRLDGPENQRKSFAEPYGHNLGGSLQLHPDSWPGGCSPYSYQSVQTDSAGYATECHAETEVSSRCLSLSSSPVLQIEPSDYVWDRRSNQYESDQRCDQAGQHNVSTTRYVQYSYWHSAGRQRLRDLVVCCQKNPLLELEDWHAGSR